MVLGRFPVALALAACLWSACAGGDATQLPPTGMGGAAAPEVARPTRGVHVLFEPGDAAALTLGSTPWPDDLYLDRSGLITLSGVGEAAVSADQARLLREALHDLDGFGVSSPIYFPLDGAIDPETLPHDEAESLGSRASAFLIDADTGSTTAYTKVPITVYWDARQKRIALRPADGHPLTPGRRYAAILTRRIQDLQGNDLQPAASFAAIKDSDVALSQPRLMAARLQYGPVLDMLGKSTGLKRSEVVGMAVFRVQSVDRDLLDVRRSIRMGRMVMPTASQVVVAPELDRSLGTGALAPVGLDELGGAPHEHLVALVHGTLSSPNLLSPMAATHGAFERDEAGRVRIKRMDLVPFTLFVPRVSAKAPIVIYQHQRDRERSDALAIANVLAENGMAVLALDAPFQGLRAKPAADKSNVDYRNRFTGTPSADEFGDVPGDFLGLREAQDGLWHPFHGRDAIRQAVVDLMVAVRAIEEGGFAAMVASQSQLKGYSFLSTHVAFVGEDIGASIGAILARVEPVVQALVFVAPAGNTFTQWSWSATDRSLLASLAPSFEQDLSAEGTFDSVPYWPSLALYQTLFDRADALAHVPALRRAAANVLVLSAEDDEQVPNRATESYAAALGATLLGTEPRYVTDLKREDVASESEFGANYAASGSLVTRVAYSYAPASHDFLIHRAGTQRFAHPLEPPFTPLQQPITFPNPTAAVVGQIASYLQSFYACVDAGAALPNTACPAATTLP